MILIKKIGKGDPEVKVIRQGVYYMEDRLVREPQAFMTSDKKAAAVSHTVLAQVLGRHADREFDALALRDAALDFFRTLDALGAGVLRYRTAIFPESHPAFMRAAAEKFGGTVVPAALATPEAYLAECAAKSGEIWLGTFRCAVGALGALSYREGGGEILAAVYGAKLARPAPFAVFLKGKCRRGVGPVDVALALSDALSAGRYTAGKVLEFFGPALPALSAEFRIAVDGMLRSDAICTLWQTDERTREYFEAHGRGEDFLALAPAQPAYYEGGIVFNLSEVEPMACREGKIVRLSSLIEEGTPFGGGKLCGVGYETGAEVAEIVRGKRLVCPLSLTPASSAVLRALAEGGYLTALLDAGVAVCGEEPAASAFPGGEDLLDARSLAASAVAGTLTRADLLPPSKRLKKPAWSGDCYAARAIRCEGGGELVYCDGVRPIPCGVPLPENLVLSVASRRDAAGGEPELSPIYRLPDDQIVKGPTMSARCVQFWKSTEGAPWEAVHKMREEQVVAVIGKCFSEKNRRHLVRWGILPLVTDVVLSAGDIVVLDDIKGAVLHGEEQILAKFYRNNRAKSIVFSLAHLTEEERRSLVEGSRIAPVRRQP